MFRRRNAVLAAAVVGALSAAGAAQQITYSFDDLPAGTAVTTQYDGVTFSVVPQSCGGSPTLYMRTGAPSGGTSSGARALGIDQGCPDFSTDYLRMVFDTLQSDVSFTVGDYAATYVVRSYSDAGLVQSQSIVVEGTGSVGVHRIVHVHITTPIIRRIEVEAMVSGLFEWIDDLTFTLDATPPVAAITFPGPLGCVCGSVTVSGSAYDPDGTYERDFLEYRSLSGSAWTQVGSATTPQEDGPLYVWNTSSLAEGFYMLRLTVEGITGLTSTAEAVAWVSQNFDTVSYTTPTIVGGTVCPDGTVWDSYCAGGYVVEYSAASPIAYAPIDPLHPSYDGYRTNEQLGSWDTRSLPDGNYLLRVTGGNDCDDTRASTHAVVVDNTAPTAVITTPASCDFVSGSVPVRGSAFDAHIAGWTLFYTGGPVHDWQRISSGVGNVTNGLLGTWNTAGLPRCEYTLRLVVVDRAGVDCGATANQFEYTVCVTLGCEADFNTDGIVNSQDFFDFLTSFFTGCP